MDTSWLATEAQTLHQVFGNLFYLFMTVLLLLGVLLEYFKFALGGTPQFSQLVGRVFIAALLLVALPEIMNLLASFTDAVVTELGGLNDFSHVLDRLGDKVKSLSFSWVSIKDMVLVIISLLSFFILYVTVYLADSFFVYAWMLLYVMSPVLIALYVLPSTAGATRELFKSLVQVCVWKILWCVMCCLLWSFAFSDINKADHDINFLTAIIVNFMLIFSVLIIPKITSAFLSGGIAGVADGFGSTLMAAASMTPGSIATKAAAPLNATRRVAKSYLWNKPIRKVANFASGKSRGQKKKTSSDREEDSSSEE
ncbi:MAG TPA: hypothetical protein VF412_17025 [Bdellovibrio sp.]|uniref:hypothetical protein n=1 Tax=Bdellovibrio sp. TaxID=28201 RepID=UPI002EEA7976